MRTVVAGLAVLAIVSASGRAASAIAPEPDLIARPSPSLQPSNATPKADGTALKEIGRIRVTTPLCKSLIGAAVGAVSIETENDRRITTAANTLQTIDLDRNELAKYQGVREITKQYTELRQASLAGNQLMRNFREQARTATTPEQRENFKTFADALDGALRRQRLIAEDIGRLTAYLDAHPPVTTADHTTLVFNALLAENELRLSRQIFDARVDGPLANVPESLSTTAKNVGIEIAHRAEPIDNDERAATARIDSAFSRC